MTNANQPLFETKVVSEATDQLMSVQTEQTITSLEVAELTGKEYKHIMRDIRNVLSQLDENAQLNFGPVSYKDAQNDEISLHNFGESTYTTDHVVRGGYIGCVENSLLIFPQFVNKKQY